MFKKLFKQRGQTAVLYALLIPVLILFAGVGIDLGWYYLNVSRLQNAADAAALAGASKITDMLNGEDLINNDQAKLYYLGPLIDPPSDLKNYEKITLKNLTNYYSSEQLDINEGRKHANEYANKNLNINYDTAVASATAAVINSWDTSEENKNVTFSSALYARGIDTQKDVRGALYYSVVLSEKITHLFLGGFDPMEATAVAYVIISPHNTDFKSIIDAESNSGVIFRRMVGESDAAGTLEDISGKVLVNWEYQKRHSDTYTGKWNHYQNTTISYDKDKNIAYRTENITVNSSTDSNRKNSLSATSLTGNKFYKEDEIDSLNIDFRGEIKTAFNSDWDLGTTTNLTYDTKFQNGWTKENGDTLRIHSAITFDGVYKTRSGQTSPDPLWVRIESEPIIQIDNNKVPSNSVRQITLNLNADNSDADATRPLVVFYDGPEQLDKSTTNRVSQAVVINLNEDFNGILYMPNSPVIINGNGHKFTGFVIAKEFRKLAEVDDIVLGTKTVVDAYGNEHRPNGYTKVTDGYGNILFIKQGQYIPEATFNEQYKNYSVETDDKGNVSIYREPGGFDELYVNGLTKYRGITDFSTIKFSNDGYNTTKSFKVATEDLKTASEVNTSDSTYVQVFKDGSPYYMEKTKLPYVRVRRNNAYIYASVYDIKITKPANSNGIRFVNDDTDADLESADSRDIYSSIREQYEKEQYGKTQPDKTKDPTKITKVVDTEANAKYFTLPDSDTKYFIGDVSYLRSSDTERTAIAEYRRVTDDDGNVYYINKEETIDYMGTVEEGDTNETLMIVDSKGNLLMKEKPLSDASYNATRPTNSSEQPLDKQRIADSSLEVVYYNTAFNLSDDSHYSYFGIEELERTVYTYLNKQPDKDIVDMFYTTRRASWMD